MATKVIYIGGYGRSGSTLLERLLTQSSQVVGCGELVRRSKSLPAMFARASSDQAICTCGQPPEKCEIWGRFAAGTRSHPRLAVALRDHVAGRYEAMVDSSKTAWLSQLAPFRINAGAGGAFVLIHMVRDPRGVVWSILANPITSNNAIVSKQTGPLRRLGRGLITIAGWWMANLSCELFGTLYPNRYIRVCYKNLAQDPNNVITELFARLGIEKTSGYGAVNNRHQLYGNRMRLEPLIAVREDVSWEIDMPIRFAKMIEILSYPLFRRYDSLPPNRR